MNLEARLSWIPWVGPKSNDNNYQDRKSCEGRGGEWGHKPSAASEPELGEQGKASRGSVGLGNPLISDSRPPELGESTDVWLGAALSALICCSVSRNLLHHIRNAIFCMIILHP